MSNVIDFLGRAGRDSRSRRASWVDVESASASALVEPELQAAILTRAPSGLETLPECMPLPCKQSPGRNDGEEHSSKKGEEALRRPCSASRLG
jgi:hypothetical protein